ncbi:MAG: hypothetical protein A3F68_10585 [Acidobacteria bacterium RIFCSPLOWO2_12_FULL_54_10]|nr:MAG: hypothetical protein A3F68_10585 [Acidobacteria bacterium RIFCSPLOWO2_12_FULL_54_10]
MIPSPIRVYVLDDHLLMRESIVAFLGTQKGFTVVGHDSSAEQARSIITRIKPDLLILELTLPGQASLSLVGELAALSPNTKTITMASVEQKEDIVEAFRLGARGFIPKQIAAGLFLKCLQKIHEGEIWLNGRLTEAVLSALGSQQTSRNADDKSKLSQREMEVVQLVVQGCKNQDIADKLFISEKTVKNHLSAIFHKLGVTGRLELTLHVFEKRLFPATLEHAQTTN